MLNVFIVKKPNPLFIFFLYHFKFSSREIEFAPRREGRSVEEQKVELVQS